MVFPASWISLLVVVNLALQVWDGCATYYGLSQGVQEGNPLLHPCMEYWGPGVTLVGAKSAAGVFLVYLREVASLSVSQWGLVLAALSYVVGSVVPQFIFCSGVAKRAAKDARPEVKREELQQAFLWKTGEEFAPEDG